MKAKNEKKKDAQGFLPKILHKAEVPMRPRVSGPYKKMLKAPSGENPSLSHASLAE